MHLILALLAAAACVALGALAAERLSAREKLMDGWDNALRRMQVLVAQGGEGLPSILRKGAGDAVPTLREAAELLEKEPAMPPEKLVDALSFDPLFTPAEREAAQDAVKGLFSPTLEMQLQALSYAREQWALFRRVCREAREQNARLYTSLGWLAGAAAFILMC